MGEYVGIYTFGDFPGDGACCDMDAQERTESR